MPLEEEEDEHHQQEGRGIHQQDQPIWVRVDRSILICPVLLVHLGPYRVQVFNSGTNRFRRVDSGLNLGSMLIRLWIWIWIRIWIRLPIWIYKTQSSEDMNRN